MPGMGGDSHECGSHGYGRMGMIAMVSHGCGSHGCHRMIIVLEGQIYLIHSESFLNAVGEIPLFLL